MKTVEGDYNGAGKQFAIVIARWNSFVVESLLAGALDGLKRHGVDTENNVTVYYCPGCFEIPTVTQKVAKTGKYNAIITLGAVIRGATPHFDYVAGEAAKIGTVSLETGVPCIFGVLTTDTIEQAIERSGTKAGNKGFEAAMVAIEMATLIEKI